LEEERETERKRENDEELKKIKRIKKYYLNEMVAKIEPLIWCEL